MPGYQPDGNHSDRPRLLGRISERPGSTSPSIVRVVEANKWSQACRGASRKQSYKRYKNNSRSSFKARLSILESHLPLVGRQVSEKRLGVPRSFESFSISATISSSWGMKYNFFPSRLHEAVSRPLTDTDHLTECVGLVCTSSCILPLLPVLECSVATSTSSSGYSFRSCGRLCATAKNYS